MISVSTSFACRFWFLAIALFTIAAFAAPGIEIDDDANAGADAVVLVPLAPAEALEDEREANVAEEAKAEDRKEKEEEDKEDSDEIDENDPFAAILKKQPQFKAHVLQTRNSVEWIMGGDLTFAARVCDATLEEKQQMRELAQIEMHKILEHVAEQLKAQFGWRAFMVAGKNEQKSPRKLRNAAVERILTAVYWPGKAAGDKKPKQIETWEESLREREEFTLLANARVFVESLNDRLYLDADQRRALTQSIADCWKDEWHVYINVMIHNPEYFPNLPKEAMKPHLDAEQYELWKAMPKSQMSQLPWQAVQNGGLFQNPNGNRNVWFSKPDDEEPHAVAERLAAVRRRVARIEKQKEQADLQKQARRDRQKRDPVSLHKLGMLGMQSGASVIKQAIADGADVNETNDKGVTPLHVAAKNGVLTTVVLLLECGADRDAKNKDGKTPAEVARIAGHEKVAAKLEEVKDE